MSKKKVFVGIDVTKEELEFAVFPRADTETWPNTEEGIVRLVDHLKSLCSTLVVLEATGGLEMPCVGALAAEGLPLVVMNPRQIRDFAKATGRLAKTDRIDARAIARFAEAVRPEIRQWQETALIGLLCL